MLKGLGRRKRSKARVVLYANGSGLVYMNRTHIAVYLQGSFYRMQRLEAPFSALGLDKQYDLLIRAQGGGLKGQLDSAVLAVGRALTQTAEKNRKFLRKKEVFDTRFTFQRTKKIRIKKS
jgi:small subunit ribosomal protein S9